MKSTLIQIFIATFLFSCQSDSTHSEASANPIDSLRVQTKQETSDESPPAAAAANDLFNEALAELYKVFKYKAQETQGDRLYLSNQSAVETLADQFKACYQIDDTKTKSDCNANFDAIQGVKVAFIKGEEPLEGQLYLKAHIQEWTFDNEGIAEAFERSLNACDMYADCVNKGGIDWWRVEHKLYLIETPAYRYSFEFEKIKEVMNRSLERSDS